MRIIDPCTRPDACPVCQPGIPDACPPVGPVVHLDGGGTRADYGCGCGAVWTAEHDRFGFLMWQALAVGAEAARKAA